MVACSGGENLAAQRPFAHVVGRCIDADQEFAAGGNQLVDGIAPVEPPFPELFIVPRIFADGQCHCGVFDLRELLILGGREIACFVKDIIGGEQHFGLPEDDGAFLQNGRAVGGPFAGGRVCAAHVTADDGQAQVRRLRCEPLQVLFGPLDKCGFLDQIPRRITRNRQFGEHHHFCPATRGFVRCRDHTRDVAREVADGRVDLCKRDFHREFYSGTAAIAFGRRMNL